MKVACLSGSFCFSDADYGYNVQQDNSLGEWEHSLFVLSTVVSRNVKSKRAVIDAGLKASSFDSGPPRLWPFDKYAEVKVQNGGDEHGILIFPQVGILKPNNPNVGIGALATSAIAADYPL